MQRINCGIMFRVTTRIPGPIVASISGFLGPAIGDPIFVQNLQTKRPPMAQLGPMVEAHSRDTREGGNSA